MSDLPDDPAGLERGIDAPVGGRRGVSLKLTVTVRQMHKRFDQSVADIGITRARWTLVAVVSRRPGITQREAAQILEMSEAAVGRLIDRLCAEGMLARRQKEADRRAYRLHLTDAARALLDRISAVATTHEDDVFAGFSTDDLARLDGYLDRIAANIAATERPPLTS